MDTEWNLYTTREIHGVQEIADALRSGRDDILRDWITRVRDNTAIKSGESLTDPLLLDHLPQLFDAIIDRLDANRPREEAEQYAAVHGFTRRITGYDVLESVIELLVFRHAIWAHLAAVDAPLAGAVAAMERVDGMVDRAVISSLRAFLDPGARMLPRNDGVGSDGAGPVDAEESTPPD
jgi:hypothetical protein